MSPGLTIAAILVTMTILSLIEAIAPLHARGRWNDAHLGPNLSLTFITFATNAFLNAGLVLLVAYLEAKGIGLLHALSVAPLPAAGIAILSLDFSFYVAHRAMHADSGLWRFHSVHHSDPAVDVTTTVRQHPVEGLIRYAFMTAAVAAVGPSPAAFAIYRLWSALNGLFEHANVRTPRRLDDLLSLVITTPNVHKVHHSRVKTETNTNYGNITSLFDRLFSTFTSSARGVNIVYGLDGFDDPATQTTAGLLALPFRPFRRKEDDDAKHCLGGRTSLDLS